MPALSYLSILQQIKGKFRKFYCNYSKAFHSKPNIRKTYAGNCLNNFFLKAFQI